MALHICILGIDGSGKSTITSSLPTILASELNLRVGSTGDAFRVVEAGEDHLAPGFHPDGLPFTARLSTWFKRQTKRVVDSRRIYPFLKLLQMMFQADAARRLGLQYAADVMVSDGNLLLSTAGRAANYLCPAGNGVHRTLPHAGDLKAVFEYVLDGNPLPEENPTGLLRLEKFRWVHRLTRYLGLRAVWLPDIVIFLDLSSDTALKRIVSRGRKIDRHENRVDLAQARAMYLKALEAFEHYRSPGAVHRIEVDNLTPGETLRTIIELLRPSILGWQSAKMCRKVPLGTTPTILTNGSVWAKIRNHRYLIRYLVRKWFHGAWREPTFLFSKLGRLFLREGYSAGVMRAIYDRDDKPCGLPDRIFLEYPLHRAVYDRLQILTQKLEPELEKRLRTGREIRIFTAPSGFAYDLFRPLEAIARRTPEALAQVRLVAADLDPHRRLAGALTARAERLGIRFEFLQGDLTDGNLRSRFETASPYDLILFVGLSGWLPKTDLIRHLKWVRENIRQDGLFVSDAFTPKSYALSGRYMGYKAHYYTPDVYGALMDYCGFDQVSVTSGRDRINHVLLFSPGKPSEINKADFQPEPHHRPSFCVDILSSRVLHSVTAGP